MRTLLAKVAAGTVLSLGAMSTAEAAGFNFSYILEDGDILSGMLEGELQSDGDTVFVSGITMPMFNGAPAPELPFLISVESIFGLPAVTPAVTLSGSLMNLVACSTSTVQCTDNFAFDTSGLLASVPAYLSSDSYGARTELYNPDRWELTAKDVPEPASMLGLLAVGAVGAASKLKSAKK